MIENIILILEIVLGIKFDVVEISIRMLDAACEAWKENKTINNNTKRMN